MISNKLTNAPHVVKEDSTTVRERFAFIKLIQSLIHEYGEYHDVTLDVDVSMLTISDKRLVLAYVVDSEELEWAHESHTKTEALFKEHLSHIQRLFDDESHEVYVEAMEERGLIRNEYRDNGEVYWSAR